MTTVKCLNCNKEWQEVKVLNTTEKIQGELVAYTKNMSRLKCICGSNEVVKKQIKFNGWGGIGKYSATNAINRRK